MLKLIVAGANVNQKSAENAGNYKVHFTIIKIFLLAYNLSFVKDV